MRAMEEPRDVPWSSLHALIHETRSPLTVVAYASEILLESGGAMPAQTVRRHMESIHHACHEASSYITLLSRCVEVEQAGQCPVPEPFPVEAFRDPEARVPGPAIPGTADVPLDLRLAGGLASTLWEVASLIPGKRPSLKAVEVDSRQVQLRLLAPELLGRLLSQAETPARRKPRGHAGPEPSFAIGFRACLIRRCLALLGGSVECARAGEALCTLVIRIPLHAPRPATGQNPPLHPKNPCK